MMNIERTTDIERIHELLNKSYRRRVPKTSSTRAATDPNIIVLAGKFGGMMFQPDPDIAGDYKVTLFITPDGRGAWGKAFIVAAITWMFDNTKAQRIIGLSAPATTNKLRLAYQPKNGVFEKVNGNDKLGGRWIYRREDWKN